MKLPSLNEVEILVKSSNLDNLRILHLSDLHINKKTKIQTLKELINICNNSDSDFVVITGDIIDCKIKYIFNKVKILNNINKKTFFISGNHDLFYGLNELKLCLNRLECLDNKTTFINYKDKQIAIAGLSDRFSKFFKEKREETKIVDFLKNYEDSIFLAHQPKDYKFALNANAKLFLCGHTHGGQIFPFHYIVKVFQPFLDGLHYLNNTAIYVNKGLGYWGINYRYKANNEITLLKLISNSVK